jgi:hypothetical protein
MRRKSFLRHRRTGAKPRVLVIPIARATTLLPYRDGCDKPGHDAAEKNGA